MSASAVAAWAMTADSTTKKAIPIVRRMEVIYRPRCLSKRSGMFCGFLVHPIRLA